MNSSDQIDLCNIKVPVFEGPLDLLLHLIREHKIDIYDIPIALITRQYLQYLEMMKELNLEIAGEFLLMAATLIHIKSRMLLPVDETVAPEDAEDPRLELVQRLLEYQALKDAALSLKEREEKWRDYFWREPLPDPEEVVQETERDLSLFDLSLFDLMGAFRKFLDRAPLEAVEITRETLTVKDKISFIIDMLSAVETMRFEALFSEDGSRVQMVVTFVALLEIIRLGLARAYQDREFGIIWIINPQAGNKQIRDEQQAPDSGTSSHS
jgi:segregation and condensation protein A